MRINALSDNLNQENILAYCGVNCRACDTFKATQSNNIQNLNIMARHLSMTFQKKITISDIQCDGCKGDGRHCFYCGYDCTIKSCAIEKNHSTCIECKDFPCSTLASFFKKKPEAKTNLQLLRKSTPLSESTC